MTLIALTQVQLTTQSGKFDARRGFDRAMAWKQQAVTARLTTFLRLRGREVAQCHFEQRLFFIHHVSQVRAYRLTVDHRLPAALQKPEQVRVAAKSVTLVEGLPQG